MIYFLNFRQATSILGDTVGKGRIEQLAGFPFKLGTDNDLRLESQITFLIHGYNVDKNTSQKKLVDFAAYLSANSTHNSAYVAVSWPGNSPQLGFASYPIEGRDADTTAAHMVSFIDRAIRPTAELSFVAHSLGARVVLETIRIQQEEGKKNPIGQICLMAAAVDDFSLATPTYRKAVESTKRVAVLASKDDTILRRYYLIGDLLEHFVVADQLTGKALGYQGPRPYKGQAYPSQVFSVVLDRSLEVDHGDYFPDPKPGQAPGPSGAMNFARAILEGVPSPQYA